MLTIPAQVKESIRRAKAWRNENWEDGECGKPKSYLLSLLVAKAYEMCQDPDPERY